VPTVGQQVVSDGTIASFSCWSPSARAIIAARGGTRQVPEEVRRKGSGRRRRRRRRRKVYSRLTQ